MTEPPRLPSQDATVRDTLPQGEHLKALFLSGCEVDTIANNNDTISLSYQRDAEAGRENHPFGRPEMEFAAPSSACGARQVFTAVAPPGQRESPLYLRCCQCGRERDDLADFYGAAS